MGVGPEQDWGRGYMPQEASRGVETVTPVYYWTEGHFSANPTL